jgi:hypothetical protein
MINHSELVDLAYKWVLARGGCGVAFKELKSIASEIPDVIGFFSGGSVLIECKVTRSDFLSDKNKACRKTKGMGMFRYYMCEESVISKDELPDKWGLIYVTPEKGVKVIKNVRLVHSIKGIPHDVTSPVAYWLCHYPCAFEPNLEEERRLMYSALRRLFIKGCAKYFVKAIES